MAILLLFSAACVLAVVLTPVLRGLALKWGLVDHPDQTRKLHSRPIARVGGLVILTVCALAAWAVHSPLVLRLAPAVLVVFAIGLADDLWDIRPWKKFAGQIAAALLAYAGGVHIGFAGQALPGWICLPATVFWLVLCTNAVNLIDGLDGLATGVGLFATCTMMVAALLQNNYDLALAVAPLMGCLLGFLRYNFNPATVFLGDSGSLTIGLFLGCCSVIWSEKSATILGMTAPMLAMSVPLLDTGLAVARRMLRGKPIFGADRGHIHHRLLDLGLTPRRAALLIYGICAVGAALALLMMYQRMEGLVIVLFCVAAWVGIRHLGYVEFGLAGRMLAQGAFTGLLNSHAELQAIEKRFADAATADDCWQIVRESARKFGFHAIEMEFAGQTYREVKRDRVERACWQARIPLADFAHIELSREFGIEAEHRTVAAFADLMRRSLAPKAGQWADRSRDLPEWAGTTR